MAETPIADRAKKVIEFDQFRREYRERKRPLVVQIEGCEYELPAELPASVMLMLLRYMREHGADAELTDIPNEIAMEMMADLLGSEQMERIVREHQLDMVELVALLEMILDCYTGQMQPPTAPEGNGETAPAASRSTSSNTGRSSKRTSAESTLSA